MVRQMSMDDHAATPAIRPQLSRFFPGNTVEGLFSRHEQKAGPLSEWAAAQLDHRYDVRVAGDGVTIAVKGQLTGRAAPAFVAKLFPGLNLAHYQYEKMTGFCQLQGRRHGRERHDFHWTGL